MESSSDPKSHKVDFTRRAVGIGGVDAPMHALPSALRESIGPPNPGRSLCGRTWRVSVTTSGASIELSARRSISSGLPHSECCTACSTSSRRFETTTGSSDSCLRRQQLFTRSLRVDRTPALRHVHDDSCRATPHAPERPRQQSRWSNRH